MSNSKPETSSAPGKSESAERILTPPWSDDLIYELKSSGFVANTSDLLQIIDLSSSKHVIYGITLTDRKILIKKPLQNSNKELGSPYFESAFYASVQRNTTLKSAMPEYYGYNDLTQSLCIEYIPLAHAIPSASSLTEDELEYLTEFLSVLHALPQLNHKSFFALNKNARTKISQKLFIEPMIPFDITVSETVDTEWAEQTGRLKKNIRLKTSLASLANIWIRNGTTLTHGDFKGGNWLRTPGGIKVIDPEHAALGLAEYDTAVLLSHLKLSLTSENLIDQLLSKYEKGKNFDFRLFLSFTGAEMLRILFLPLHEQPDYLAPKNRYNLLHEAANLVLINHPKII
ncbi:MAG: phosphotransferase [Cyclobacteriaceae bacterium]|nr:phosphotransferase [Cyclobacteriaceae bacterium]